MALSAADLDAIVRLIDGQSLPADMQEWRRGLLGRVRAELAQVQAVEAEQWAVEQPHRGGAFRP